MLAANRILKISMERAEARNKVLISISHPSLGRSGAKAAPSVFEGLIREIAFFRLYNYR